MILLGRQIEVGNNTIRIERPHNLGSLTPIQHHHRKINPRKNPWIPKRWCMDDIEEQKDAM
jgi:hypothetical protein